MTIKETREKSGLKAYWVAKKLGIKPSTYCDKEKGRRRFTLKEVIELRKYLEIDIDNLDGIK